MLASLGAKLSWLIPGAADRNKAALLSLLEEEAASETPSKAPKGQAKAGTSVAKSGATKAKKPKAKAKAQAAANAVASASANATAPPQLAPLPRQPSPTATVEPILRYPGGDFRRRDAPVDLCAEPICCSETFGGSLSIAFECCWNVLDAGIRLIDFGSGAAKDNVVIGSGEDERTLVIDVNRGDKRKRLTLPSSIALGETHRYLFTVEDSGHMRLFCDGDLLGELVKGHAPKTVARSHLFVGGAAWSNAGGSPSSETGVGFEGRLTDVRLWRQIVAWDVAFSAALATPKAGDVRDQERKAAEISQEAEAPKGCKTCEAEIEASEDACRESDLQPTEKDLRIRAKKAERKARKAKEREDRGSEATQGQENLDTYHAHAHSKDSILGEKGEDTHDPKDHEFTVVGSRRAPKTQNQSDKIVAQDPPSKPRPSRQRAWHEVEEDDERLVYGRENAGIIDVVDVKLKSSNVMKQSVGVPLAQNGQAQMQNVQAAFSSNKIKGNVVQSSNGAHGNGLKPRPPHERDLRKAEMPRREHENVKLRTSDSELLARKQNEHSVRIEEEKTAELEKEKMRLASEEIKRFISMPVNGSADADNVNNSSLHASAPVPLPPLNNDTQRLAQPLNGCSIAPPLMPAIPGASNQSHGNMNSAYADEAGVTGRHLTAGEMQLMDALGASDGNDSLHTSSFASPHVAATPSQSGDKFCWEWVHQGWCPRGSTCRWEHPSHVQEQPPHIQTVVPVQFVDTYSYQENYQFWPGDLGDGGNPSWNGFPQDHSWSEHPPQSQGIAMQPIMIAPADMSHGGCCAGGAPGHYTNPVFIPGLDVSQMHASPTSYDAGMIHDQGIPVDEIPDTP
eukprot:TRINITY_DN29080_c0_g2_i2.p1 TRINITY_DN29080_c0_g2~~TRINITY_DN29080_c0_g2_i2.p1  ORF type:complete len:849 (-),score=111.78 TRINITY_DN29080_c0_g2_i2:54-2600(-)